MNEVAAMSDLKEEILSKLNMEPGSGYRFYLDVMEAIDALPDEQWDELSDEAQEWFNENAARLSENKPILDFDGNVLEMGSDDSELTTEVGAESEPEREVEAKKEDAKEEEAVSATKPKKRKKENSGIPNGRLVREFFIRKGVETETDIILKMLHDHGRSMTKSSINMVRYELKQTLTVLKSLGLIDKSVGGIF